MFKLNDVLDNRFHLDLRDNNPLENKRHLTPLHLHYVNAHKLS